MKTIIAIIVALVLGTGIGIGVGWLRIFSTPWDGPPPVDLEHVSAIPAGAGPAPVADVDRLEFDFGKLDLEKTGRQEFTVTNRGTAILKLTRGETTCRCTVSDLERSDVSPGESTKIILTWRPTAEPGPYQQSATFLTNDPKRPRFTITITGQVTATLRVRPALVSFGRISAQETSHAEATILSYLDEPLQLGAPRFEQNDIAQYFDAAVTPLENSELNANMSAKSGYRLAVTIKPGLPHGPFKQTITLGTNNSNRKVLAVPLEGSVGSEISVVGPGWDAEHEALYLGPVKSQEGLSCRLLLVVRGPYRKEVRFKLAEPVPVPLKITLGEPTDINNGQLIQTPLLIEIPKGSPQASHLGVQEDGKDVPEESATIHLQTTHPDTPTLRIPVRFAVEK